MDDRIDGVVITFADITVAKTLEAKLRGQHASLEKDMASQASKSAATTVPKSTKEVRKRVAPAHRRTSSHAIETHQHGVAPSRRSTAAKAAEESGCEACGFQDGRGCPAPAP
jgi:hypothetical protein